jgi:hypothetical protein
MEKWTPTADLQIVSDNLMQCLSIKKSQLTMGFLHQSFFHQSFFHQSFFHQNLLASLHNYSPGFPNYLAQFFLQNPSLQPVFHRMPVEGGVI